MKIENKTTNMKCKLCDKNGIIFFGSSLLCGDHAVKYNQLMNKQREEELERCR